MKVLTVKDFTGKTEMETNIKGKIILLIVLTLLCLIIKMTSVLGGDLRTIHHSKKISGISVKQLLPVNIKDDILRLER